MKSIIISQEHADVASPLTVTEREISIEEPSLYHVILLNDDYTPMDFVIEILIQFFDKTADQAYDIMMQVHENHSGIAGTYSLEIAEEKRRQVTWSAEANEFPLNCIIESA